MRRTRAMWISPVAMSVKKRAHLLVHKQTGGKRALSAEERRASPPRHMHAAHSRMGGTPGEARGRHGKRHFARIKWDEGGAMALVSPIAPRHSRPRVLGLGFRVWVEGDATLSPIKRA